MSSVKPRPMRLGDSTDVPYEAPPASAAHGSDGCGNRQFASRHVPGPAEELATSESISPHKTMRFNGLLKLMKPNSATENEEKSVLFASSGEDFIPEEFRNMLMNEFEVCCHYGERTNMDLMSSAKWVKFLRDRDFIKLSQKGPSADKFGLSLPEADIIYHKVIRNCDYGGKRLTYEMFCKALKLTSTLLYPEMGDDALGHLLIKVSEAAGDDSRCAVCLEPSLNIDLHNILEHYDPVLQNLFSTYSGRDLENPASPSRGRGSVRIQEREAWNHDRSDMIAGCTSPTRARCLQGFANDLARSTATLSTVCASDRVQLLSDLPEEATSMSNCQEEATAVLSCQEETTTMVSLTANDPSHVEVLPGASMHRDETCMQVDAEKDEDNSSVSMTHSDAIETKPVSPTKQTCKPTSISPRKKTTPYLYANGAPVIRQRSKRMSLDQLLTCCKDLDIFPSMLSRTEITRIFKRVQASSSPSGRGTLYSYLTREMFCEVLVQVALEAHAYEPYNSEYPRPQDKVLALLFKCLPHSVRLRHEWRRIPGCQ